MVKMLISQYKGMLVTHLMIMGVKHWIYNRQRVNTLIMRHLFIDAFRSHAWKGLTSWLSFVMYNCEVVTFPLVSWVRCGA